MFPTEKYWGHFLCVWGFSHTLYCKATVAMNGNLSQEVEAGLDFQSIKLPCFQQSVLSVLNCHVTAVVTWLLFYLAGSGASSPLTSPSSPTPPSTAGTFENHYTVYLFMLVFFFIPLCPSVVVLFPRIIKGWWFSRMELGDDSLSVSMCSFEGHREHFYNYNLSWVIHDMICPGCTCLLQSLYYSRSTHIATFQAFSGPPVAVCVCSGVDGLLTLKYCLSITFFFLFFFF